jgi:hypothetical protein
MLGLFLLGVLWALVDAVLTFRYALDALSLGAPIFLSGASLCLSMLAVWMGIAFLLWIHKAYLRSQGKAD